MKSKASIILSLILIFPALCFAGTYQNSTNHSIVVKDSNGQLQTVRPGQSIGTVFVPSDPGMIKTADTPYYNPVVARHAVSSTGVGDDQTVTLTPATATHVFVWKVVGGNATIYYDSTANTPAVAILRAGDYYQHDIKARAGQLVIQFAAAGTCEVLETREAVK